MTSAPEADLSKPAAANASAVILLIVATLLMLLPFINKPFHIDDPLFVWGAKHIRENFTQRPLDFYGFEVLWSGQREPMHVVTQNPPMALYFLAAASLAGGWNEWWLHTACLLPAAGVVIGTWRLGRGMTNRPLLAGLAVLCTPIFLISSTNVMCDTLMCCFWVWSVVLWREGLQTDSEPRLIAGACLVGLAALTKYFAMSLIPLLVLFTLVRERRGLQRLLWLLIPCGMLLAYQLWTRHLYGHGLLSSAARFARENYQGTEQPWTMKWFGTFSFMGASLLCLLFYSIRISRRGIEIAIGLLIAMYLIWALLHFQPLYLKPRGVRPTSVDLAVQSALLIVTGLGALGLIAQEFWYASGMRWTTIGPFVRSLWQAGRGPRENRRPITQLASEAYSAHRERELPGRPQWADSLLLAAWVGGTLLFAGAINWTLNGRSILPLVPAAAILLCRGLDRNVGPVASPIWEVWPLIPAAAITLIATHGDYRFASTQREAAETMIAVARKNHVTLWYSGHWGFQYYMDQVGAQPVHLEMGPIEEGDLFALPENNDVQILSPPQSRLVTRYKFLMSNWASTHQPARCTGFYSDAWGALPFALGPEIPLTALGFDDSIPLEGPSSITEIEAEQAREIARLKDEAARTENPYDIYRLGRLFERVAQRPNLHHRETEPRK